MADLHPVGQALRYAIQDPRSTGYSTSSLQAKSTRSQSLVKPSSLSIHWTSPEMSSSIVPLFIPIAHDWSWVVNFAAGIVPRCWPLMDLNSKGIDCSSLAESARNARWKNIILLWSTWHGALPATSLLIQMISLDRPTGTYHQCPIESSNIPSPGPWRTSSSLSSTTIPFKGRKIPW